jgi:hypothetical protein
MKHRNDRIPAEIVASVRCGIAHAGNRSLTESQRGVYQCAGCLRMYTVEQVSRAEVCDGAGSGLLYIPITGN